MILAYTPVEVFLFNWTFLIDFGHVKSRTYFYNLTYRNNSKTAVHASVSGLAVMDQNISVANTSDPALFRGQLYFLR